MKLATFNARAETVTTKPMFRDAFKRYRCLIPAPGYYEWEDTPQGKQPHYFTRRDGKIVTVAGIWDRWRNVETGERLQSCAMIITEPNGIVAEVHDRMPVVLEEQQFEPWLSGAAGVELLKPAADDVIQRWPVSRRVNSSRIGLAPPDDRDGCLQDVHWYASPLGGAFQSYTIGNVLSAQFHAAALAAHPEIPGEIAAGRFGTLHTWLRENLYRHGRKFKPDEIVGRATGRPVTIEPYLAYLRTKYGALYRLPAAKPKASPRH